MIILHDMKTLRILLFFVAALVSGCTTTDPKIHPEGTSLSHLPEPTPESRKSPPPLQEKHISMTVEDAVFSALQYNKDLLVQELNPVIIGTFEQIERGIYDSELFSDFEYNQERISETDRATETQFDTEVREYAGSAGLRQKLPTGTDLELSVGQNRSISDRTPEQQQARVGLSMTQALLQGFGPEVNLAKIKQAQFDTLASIYELRGYVESLVSEVEITYWQYVLAHKEIAIHENSLMVAKQQSEEIQQRIDVGAIARNQAAAVKTEVALREQALIDARSTLEERRLRLARLINPSSAGGLDIEIEALSEPTTTTEALNNIQERILLAEKMRPDLKEAQLRLKKNELEVVVTRNGLLPRLDLFITLGRSGYADTFSESFQQIDGPTYDFTAGFEFNYYLGNRAAKARNLAARASREQAEKAVDNLNQLVRQDVLIAANELERLRQQIFASSQTRILQEQTVRAEKERFDVGASTSLQLALAHRDLIESQIAEVDALINYRIQLVRLYLAEGSLLERRGIQLDESPERTKNRYRFVESVSTRSLAHSN